VLAADIPAAQADVSRAGDRTFGNVAFKDGQPTPAAHAFAKKAGVDVAQLEKSHHSQGRVPGRKGHEKRAERC
jgi:glycyl-tRNA synthetase beta chain